MSEQSLLWVAFGLLMTIMLAIDLGLNRRAHKVSFRQALSWSIIWVSLALAFNAGIYTVLGKTKALEFFAGYIIEKSLSVDNLFVFIMIFGYFNIRGEHQARILKWGIIGALVLRGLFIFTGIELLTNFHWLFYLFGALLLFTAWKMAFGGNDEVDPENNLLVKLARRLFPFTKRVRGDWFFTRRQGMLVASPLFLSLVMVESSDVVFAIDSIPAIFAVTLDPFIVFSSNIFAIMGLRALYFLLAGMIGMFAYLKLAISFILAFVGGKMIATASGFHIPIQVSLTIIFTTLALAVLASLLADARNNRQIAHLENK
ncbi:TerC family protein [Pelobacter propionicus]|uniref:Integral membrane protein TerC n=1 Tax=Pelobacter propionicus (strain DSM 2379 / NBRC 103807 / OttBd1) TaxID=338966 RepID=A1AM41_PELPD|nr:TerC family protein [Pelobacter propionicus]ABK98411.1 Integral membrane protein TerC [Pelobacter propionicus DSM 2379]